MRNHHILLIAAILILPGSLIAQKGHIGLAPMFQRTLHQVKGEYDVNVTPFVIEGTVKLNRGVRLLPFLNLSVQEEGRPVYKDAGLEISLVMYIFQPESESILTHHIYVAPGGLLLIGKTNDSYGMNGEVTIFLEPGYSIHIDEEAAFAAGIQLGKTFNFKDEQKYLSNFLAFRLIFTRMM